MGYTITISLILSSSTEVAQSFLKWLGVPHVKANDGIGICPLGSRVVVVAVVVVIVVAVVVVIVVAVVVVIVIAVVVVICSCRPTPTVLSQVAKLLEVSACWYTSRPVMVEVTLLGHRAASFSFTPVPEVGLSSPFRVVARAANTAVTPSSIMACSWALVTEVVVVGSVTGGGAVTWVNLGGPSLGSLAGPTSMSLKLDHMSLGGWSVTTPGWLYKVILCICITIRAELFRTSGVPGGNLTISANNKGVVRRGPRTKRSGDPSDPSTYVGTLGIGRLVVSGNGGEGKLFEESACMSMDERGDGGGVGFKSQSI
ncbi:hypothetical protein Tco_0200673 [Tanacetum coccineum]